MVAPERHPQLKLKIKRFQKEREPQQWIETFEVNIRRGMNLLEALLRIQDEQDGTLSFRYSCRGAVCGSCAMKVNGVPVLACRTPVAPLVGKTVLIEPLPHFPVVRDLIVDISLLFQHYKSIQPYLHPRSMEKNRESLMTEKIRKEIDPYIQCILCGICYGVCPAFGREPQFLGPALLAKVYRFLKDPRDRRGEKILETVNNVKGVWGCNTVFQCVKSCPKEVPPTHAIIKMRWRLLRSKLLNLLSKGEKIL